MASTRGRRLPRRLRVPPSGFLSLSTACSAIRLCGLLPSRSHVQGSIPVQGFLLPRSRRLSSRRSLPPCRWAAPAHELGRVRCHRCGPRLRGLAPRGSAFVGAAVFSRCLQSLPSSAFTLLRALHSLAMPRIPPRGSTPGVIHRRRRLVPDLRRLEGQRSPGTGSPSAFRSTRGPGPSVSRSVRPVRGFGPPTRSPEEGVPGGLHADRKSVV